MFLLNESIHPIVDRYLGDWIPPDQTWQSLLANPNYQLAFKYLLLNGGLLLISWLWGLGLITRLLPRCMHSPAGDHTNPGTSTIAFTFLAYTTGFAILISGLFFLACIHQLDKPVTTVLFVLLTLMAIASLATGRKNLSQVSGTRGGKWLLFTTGIFVLYLVLLQFAVSGPPFIADATSYHAPYADYFLQHRGLAVNEYLMYPYHTFNINLLYSLALMITHELSFAQSVDGLLTTITMLGIFAFCRESGQRLFIALLLPFIFRTNYSVDYGAISANVDLGGVLFVFSSIFALWLWHRTSSSVFLILSAISLGLAMGTKYILAIFCLPAGLCVLYFGHPKAWQHLITYVIWAGCFGLWWYIRNAIATGNPVHPFAPGIFGYYLWDQRDMMIQMSAFDNPPIPHSLTGLLLAPWYAYRNTVLHFQGSFIILAILFSSTVFAAWVNRGMNMILCFCWIYLVSWILGTQDPRHLLPILPAVLVYGGYVLSRGYDLMLEKTIPLRFRKVILTGIGILAVICVLLYSAVIVRGKFIRIYYSNLAPGIEQDRMLQSNPQLEFIYHVNEVFGTEGTFYEMGFGLRWFMKGHVVGNPFGPHSYWRLLDEAANDSGGGVSPLKLERILKQRYNAQGVIIATSMAQSRDDFDRQLNLRYRNSEGSIYTWKDNNEITPP